MSWIAQLSIITGSVLSTIGQTPVYSNIFWIFGKTTKATSVKLSGLNQDFRLKYCGKEVFFIQATL